MAIQSSFPAEIGENKKPQLNPTSPKSSLTQGDTDSESTSVSSSMQGSVSSATSSSLDRYSSNVKEETRFKKPQKKSISKKLATFGSFVTSRRRTQSKLSQTSIKLSDDDGSITPPQSSSIEACDESSNYAQKSMPKFKRTGSLRSVKIFRTNSKNRNKNKSNFKSEKSNTSIDNISQSSEDSHLERATFSSILKDSKFPEQLKHQSRPSEPEEILPVAKICPYQHCSLHGHHHHHHEPPPQRFPYLKKRESKDRNIVKPENQTKGKSSGRKREVKATKMTTNDDSIEFYAKTRFEPVSSQDNGDAELVDILFGVNRFEEQKNEIPISNNRDFSSLNLDLSDRKDENSNGLKRVLEKKKSTNDISMWRTIHKHIVFGLAAESGDVIVPEVDDEKESQITGFDDAANQESEIKKMFAIKLVRDAIEKILLPEVQDDQSTTTEVISENDPSEKSEIASDRKDESLAPVVEEKPAMKTEKEKGAPNRWSHLKKVILLKRFVKELEKVKKFNPQKPRHLPLPLEQEAETVSLRRQMAGDKKNSDEWMLDYALQKVVSELAPTQKRKVALLVKAFETVTPTQEESPESISNGGIRRVSSESEVKIEEISELKSDLEKEKHIKMWHMIYQHVVTDIATRIGSDLLLDGEESTNSEEKNLQEVEDQTERNYKLQFTQSDAVKLVRESVDEILLPEISDSSSQDTQSTASDIPSDQEEPPENKEETVRKLQQQGSRNWAKLKKLIMVKRSIKALEGFRKLKPEIQEKEILKNETTEEERVNLRRQMMEEKKKAEQWMLDYAVQHIVTKLTPARKKRVSMLVEAFEAVVPFPEI